MRKVRDALRDYILESTINQALEMLEVDNDDHWTQDGLPQLSVLCNLLDRDVTREEVTDAYPTFTRNMDKDEEPVDENEAILEKIKDIEEDIKVLKEISEKALENLKIKQKEYNDLRSTIYSEVSHEEKAKVRMSIIRKNFNRRVKSAQQRKKYLQGIPSEIFKSGKAPIDCVGGKKRYSNR